MKRSPITRRTPLRASAPAKAELPTSRCRAKGCRARFVQLSMNHRACSVECARLVVAQDKVEKERKAQADDKRKARAAKEAIKTIPDLLKEAQREFNHYVRLRDAGRPCICCGMPLEAGAVGGGFDCGHYRSVGSAPHLRFDERNAHGQRKHCNRYGSGRAVDYRLGLLVRIGAVAVAELEANNTPIKWTRDQLREIRDRYRRLARELERNQG